MEFAGMAAAQVPNVHLEAMEEAPDESGNGDTG